MLSVNQPAAEFKLIEAWKSINVEGFPVKLEHNNVDRNTQGRSVRINTERKWKESSNSKAASISFSRDAARRWNAAPVNIKSAVTLTKAKKEVKSFCKLLEL